MQFPMKTNISKIEVDPPTDLTRNILGASPFSSSNIEQKSNQYLLQHEWRTFKILVGVTPSHLISNHANLIIFCTLFQGQDEWNTRKYTAKAGT